MEPKGRVCGRDDNGDWSVGGAGRESREGGSPRRNLSGSLLIQCLGQHLRQFLLRKTVFGGAELTADLGLRLFVHEFL